MKMRTALWAVAVVTAWAGLAILTPERIGVVLWSVVKVPVVLFLIVSWCGFVLAAITQGTEARRQMPFGAADADLSDALATGETLIASARLRTKVTVFALGLICTAFAVWDGIIRIPPQWLRTGIWASAAGALAAHLYRLLERRVTLAPSAISWNRFGRTTSRNYADVTDYRVLSSNQIQIIFSDGQKLTVTSDMADLKRVLATVTARRLS